MANEFFPSQMAVYGKHGWIKDAWKIIKYQGAGVNFPIEGVKAGGGYWSKAEAIAAAERANAGDEANIEFASYADD